MFLMIGKMALMVIERPKLEDIKFDELRQLREDDDCQTKSYRGEMQAVLRKSKRKGA